MPVITDMAVSVGEMRSLLESSRSSEWEPTRLAIPRDLPRAVAMGLAHYSVLRCRQGDDEVAAVAGPALFSSRGWHIPIHASYPIEVLEGNLLDELDEVLEQRALVPYGTRLTQPRRWQHLKFRAPTAS